MEAVADSLDYRKQNLIASMGWLIQLRTRAIILFAIVSILFAGIFGMLPRGMMFSLFAVLGLCALCNLVFHRQLQTLHEKDYGEILRDAGGQVILDICAVALFVHFSGGVENPLIIAAALPLIAACWLLPRKRCNELAAFALTLLAAMAGLEAAGILGHAELSFMTGAGLWRHAGYIALLMVSLAGLFFGAIHFLTALVAQLNEQRAYSMDLARHLETKVNTIEATLQSERIERAKLEEALRMQMADTTQEKERLATKMQELEDGVMSEIDKLTAQSGQYEINRKALVADLEEEVAGLRETLEKLEAARYTVASSAISQQTRFETSEEVGVAVKEPDVEDVEEEEDEDEEEVEIEVQAEEALDGEEDLEDAEEAEEGEEDEEEGEDDAEAVEEGEEYEEELEDDDLFEPADPLSEALLAAVREVEQAPEAEPVLMDLVLSEQLPSVTADADALQELFRGLLRGSIASMPDGGRISIATEHESNRITVKITDTSEPVDKKALPKLTAEKKLVKKMNAQLSTEVMIDDGVSYLLEIPSSNGGH